MRLRSFGHPFAGILGLVVTIVTLGCAKQSPVAKQNKESKPTPVQTVSVTETDLTRTTRQPATVHPFYRAEIRAKVSGYVREIKADIGDYVEQGAELAVIDVPELEKQQGISEARIKQFTAHEAQAKAGVELAKANVTSAKAKLDQAKSEMSRVDALLAAAEAEFTRTSDLVERRSLENRVLDEVRKRRDSELASKQATQSAIGAAEAEVNVAQAKQAAAEADLIAAQAETMVARQQLEELNVLIGYATLKAPFAGMVTQRIVDPGNLVREASEVGSGKPLFVVSQIDKVRIQMPVPEADAAFVSRGDKVTLELPSFPGEGPIEATVTRVSGDLDPSTRTMLVEAELPNPDRKLLPGMFGEATITFATQAIAKMLPARAIRFSEEGSAYVYVIDADDTVAVVPVTTGFDNGHTIEVTSGVSAGQVVIDAHLQRFSTGDKVTRIE